MSLLAWYPFNGNMNNLGLGNCSYYGGTPSFSNVGKIGQCLSSATSNINIYVPELAGLKTWSVCFWGYIVSSQITANWTAIIALMDDSSDLRIEVCTKTYESGSITYGVFNNYGYAITNKTSISPRGIECYDNWHHFCITSDGTNITIYDNGIPRSNILPYNGSGTLNGGFWIANNDKIYKNDFRVYDTCLSAKEVKDISNTLVGHWILDGSRAGQENLLIGTSMTENERSVNPLSTNDNDFTKVFRYYNGYPALHSFSDDTDEITLNETGTNIGISFLRKATDINLDTSSYYTLSCEAKCNRPNAKLSIARSYYSNSGNWIWRGGENQTAFNNTTDWQKFTLTFKPDADTQYIDYAFLVPTPTASTDYKFWIKHCKLEKGTIATPYTLNSNDADYTRLGFNSGIEHDVSGLGNHGTKYGSLELVDDSVRYFVSSKFNRSNSYINCTTKLNNIRDAITINLWTYLNAGGTGYYAILSSTQNGGFSISSNNDGGSLVFYMGTGASSNTYKIITLEGELSKVLSRWCMITYTYDGFGCKVYIDGELKANQTYFTEKTPIYYNTITPLIIGGEPNSNVSVTDILSGYASDFRIYATALSAEDIKELYETSASIDNKGNLYCNEFIET